MREMVEHIYCEFSARMPNVSDEWALTRLDQIIREHCGDPCLAKVKEGEPIFVLRAQDATASDYVRDWARDLGISVAANSNIATDSERFQRTKAKIAEANDLADRMEAWPDRKVPD